MEMERAGFKGGDLQISYNVYKPPLHTHDLREEIVR